MKSLEITTNKRLLIVERPEGKSTEEALSEYESREKWEFLVFGSHLTEEIAAGLVNKQQVFDTPEIYFFKDYKTGFGSCITARQSFISAIEAQGWHWGRNPLADEIVAPDIDEWQDAESRTFRPERCIIFEIVEG